MVHASKSKMNDDKNKSKRKCILNRLLLIILDYLISKIDYEEVVKSKCHDNINGIDYDIYTIIIIDDKEIIYQKPNNNIYLISK